MQLHYKLSDLKEKSGFTNQKISDETGIPLSTVTRICNGQTDNPSYRNVVDIIVCMDGSVDEIEGIEHPDKGISSKVLELYEREINHKNKWIQCLFTTCMALVLVFVAIVLFDVLNGNVGYVRY